MKNKRESILFNVKEIESKVEYLLNKRQWPYYIQDEINGIKRLAQEIKTIVNGTGKQRRET